MAPTRSLLLSGAALALIMGTTSISTYAANIARGAPILLAAADDAVTAAQNNVDQARAALEKAKATGEGVEEAQKALDAAMAALEQARAAEPASTAAEPPPEKAPVTPPVAAEPAPKKPAVAVEPPAAPEPPVAVAPAPPPPPVANEPAPPKAPAAETLAKNKKKKPPVANEAPAAPVEPPVAAEPAPPKPPVAEQTPVAPVEPPVAETPAPPTPPVAAEPAAPAEPAPPPVAAAPAAPGEPPPPPVAEAPAAPAGTPPPPPVATGPTPPPPTAEAAKSPVPVVDAAQATSGKPGPKSLDGRVIVKESDNRLFIQHDEDARFRIPGAKFGTMTAADGTTITTINRPDGSQIVTITDKDGNLIRRTRKLPNGQVIVLIDSKPEAPDRRLKTIDYFKRLPPIVLNIPRQDYVVESQKASPQQLQLALQAPPVEMVERPYSLDEIRQSERLRDKVRRIDVDTVTFEFGQAAVPPDQVGSLAEIGRALAAIIRRDPGQVYLIEGHTDAVGTDIANLALSDRRAESVADILTAYYDIPAENLVTQGYGEQYLKIPTEAPERQNRRVTVRNITPLLKADNG